MQSNRLDFALFCDDVRQEGNGKLIFIGVYNESIIINRNRSNPDDQTQVNLTARLQHLKEGLTTLSYEVELNSVISRRGNVDISAEHLHHSYISIPIRFSNSASGSLLTVRLFDETLATIGEHSIEIIASDA